MDGYTFNAGSSSQGMDGSYAMIRELCRYNEVKEIYLEMYYGIAELEENSERTQMTATYILSDYMKPSFRKISFVCRACDRDYWLYGFSPALRERKKMFESGYIRDLTAKKKTSEYRNYIWTKTDNPEYYVDRGFVANDSDYDGSFWDTKSEGSIEKSIALIKDNDWYKSLEQIISFCGRKGIKLVFVIAPEPERTVIGAEKYQEYHDFVGDIALQNGLEFYDFNLCKAEYFDNGDWAYFKDSDHLNTKGAEAFSDIFAKLCSDRVSKEDLFYDSLPEKERGEEPAVLGISGPCFDKSGYGICHVISNRDTKLEYRIEAGEDSEHMVILRDWLEEKSFILPAEGQGFLRVSWREKNGDKSGCIDTVY